MRKFLLLTGAALFALALTSSSALAAVNVKRLPVADFGNPDAASVTLFGGNFSGLGSVPAIATWRSRERLTMIARTRRVICPPARILWRRSRGLRVRTSATLTIMGAARSMI